jgi:hypothetical protein
MRKINARVISSEDNFTARDREHVIYPQRQTAWPASKSAVAAKMIPDDGPIRNLKRFASTLSAI